MIPFIDSFKSSQELRNLSSGSASAPSPQDRRSSSSSSDEELAETNVKSEPPIVLTSSISQSSKVTLRQVVTLWAERHLLGLFVVLFIGFAMYGFSNLQWIPKQQGGVRGVGEGGKGYFNESVYVTFWIFAFVLFGPVYIGASLYVMYGWKRVLASKCLFVLIPAAISACLIFVIAYFGAGLKFWFYYVDFLCILLVYCPVDFACVYMIIRLPKENGEVLSSQQAIKIALHYTIPDTVVAIMVLTYMQFLLPTFFSLQSDVQKLAWRVLFHPVYFSIISVCSRYFAYKELSTENVVLNANLVLHMFFHHQTVGRILITTLQSYTFIALAIIISTVESTVLRCTSIKRDELIFNLWMPKEKAQALIRDPRNLIIRSTIQNITVALEFSGIFTAPAFMLFFTKWGNLFHMLGNGQNAGDMTTMFAYAVVVGIVFDAIGDFIATYWEIHKLQLPVVKTWNWLKTYRTFYFWLVYGSLTMGLMFMVWMCAGVPRAFTCKTADICSCNSFTNPPWLQPICA